MRNVRIALFILLAMIMPLSAFGTQASTTSSHRKGQATSLASTSTGSTDVSIVTYDTETGQYAPGACYQLVGFSNTGCDENNDGFVEFADVPFGRYTVHAETAMDGRDLKIADLEIDVQEYSGTFFTEVGIQLEPSTKSDTLTVQSVTPEGTQLTTACYELVGFSDVGCDDNTDGYVTFEGVPAGKYTLRQTADISPYVAQDMTIDYKATFDANYVVNLSYAQGGNSSKTGASTGNPTAAATDGIQVSLITRNPENGKLIPGACYQLVDFSDEGCDENRDGQVDFANVPNGTYTVHQTSGPQGTPVTQDFKITIDSTLPKNLGINRLAIPVMARANQVTEGASSYSVVFYDAKAKGVVTNGSCAQIEDASDVGCDQDLIDGQVDFLDVKTTSPKILTDGQIACPFVTQKVNGLDYSYTKIHDGLTIYYVPLENTGKTC